jgi:uncharacterized protein YcbX
MPDEYLAQVAIAGHEAEGNLTQLSNAMAAPAGTFFDVAPLHLLTEATLRQLNDLQPTSRFDVARFRPNVVLEGDVTAFAENDWAGSTMTIGAQVSASVLLPTMRCIMTTLPQADLPRDNETLRTVSRHNRIDIPGLGKWSCAGAYATIMASGSVTTGDRWVS